MSDEYMPIIFLKDSEVVTITTDIEYTSGCPTCDYGSTYCLEISLSLRKHIIIARWENENIRPSVAQLVRILSKDFSEMTETEFIEYVKTRLEDASISVLEWSK